MAREIDEAWIDEAIERYRRIDALRDEFDKTAATTEVAVRSPDGSVEVLVTATGEITDVRIQGPLRHRTAADVSRQVSSAVTAAADAARWARRKLHGEIFDGYEPLGRR